MNRITVALALFAGSGVCFAGENQGQVVLEKRTFTVSVENCRKTFEKQEFNSTCDYHDESVTNRVGDVKVAGTADYSHSVDRGGRDSAHTIQLSALVDGYTISFADEGDGGISRPLDFDSARPLLEKAIKDLGGKVEVYVYTTQ